MCYTCGCKLPYDNHGDENNIIEDDLAKAGKTEAIKQAGPTKSKENMQELIGLQQEHGELDNPKESYQ
jgi:hypothetical protein